MLTTKQKNLLRAYWKRTYAAVRIRKGGTVEAKKSLYTTWGVLETPDMALRSAEVLEERAKRNGYKKMIKAKHTKGPWHIGKRPGPLVYGEDGTEVADCNRITNMDEENTANERLVAAAPELLERVEKMAWLLSEMHSGNEFSKSFLWAEYERTFEVLSKARGE